MKIRMIGLSVVVVVTLSSVPALAATYYVRADGAAENKSAATSDASPETAMSLSKHNNLSFAPGDVIIISDAGGVYRGSLYPRSAGSASAQVTYRAKGSPELSGADVIKGWSVYSGSIWQAVVSTNPPQVFIDGVFGDRKGARSEVVGSRDWYWESNTLYLYSSVDPDTLSGPGVEASIRSPIIGMGKDYVTYDGLLVTKSSGAGFKSTTPGSNSIIKNCTMEWNWNWGLEIGGTTVTKTGIIVEDNVARYNGSGGLNFNQRLTNVTIRGNRVYLNGKYQSDPIIYNPFHAWAAGIKLWENVGVMEGFKIYSNEVFRNGRGLPGDPRGRGSGIWVDAVQGNPGNPIMIRHNLVHENKATGIFIEISSNTITYGNVLNNNASNDGGPPANILLDTRESYVTTNNKVYNNTSYGGRVGIHVGAYNTRPGMEISNNIIRNNVIVGAEEQNLYCHTGGDNDGVRGWGNVYENNSFGVESGGFIRWGGSYLSTYAAWEAAYGKPTNSVQGDPQLAGTSRTSLYLKSTSPCIDAGEDLGTAYRSGLRASSVWTDSVRLADQNAYGSGWDVGAYVDSNQDQHTDRH
jgi:parallel beta-helix repeat protein